MKTEQNHPSELSGLLNAQKHEALTIQAMRIVEFCRMYSCDADMIQDHFLGEIGQYERDLADREGISI